MNGKRRVEHDEDPLMTAGEVAAWCQVRPKTVTRWAKEGRLDAVRTLGGHRRYRMSEVRRFQERRVTSGG